MKTFLKWAAGLAFLAVVIGTAVGVQPGQLQTAPGPTVNVQNVCGTDVAMKIVASPHAFRGVHNQVSTNGNHYHADGIWAEAGSDDAYRIVADCFVDAAGQPHTTMTVQ